MDAIYRQYFPGVYRYVLSLCRNETVAQDVTSETFLKAVKAIDTFRGDCDIRVWLCQIAKNTYFSWRKKAKDTLPLGAAIDVPNVGDDVSSTLVDRAAALDVHRRLHQLDEPYKEVFSLRTFGELSFAEIAGLFGKTESWARVTYHRAKLKLQESLS